jgi:hypothetical protein
MVNASATYGDGIPRGQELTSLAMVLMGMRRAVARLGDLMGMRQRERQRDEEDSRRSLVSSSPHNNQFATVAAKGCRRPGAPWPLRAAGGPLPLGTHQFPSAGRSEQDHNFQQL